MIGINFIALLLVFGVAFASKASVNSVHCYAFAAFNELKLNSHTCSAQIENRLPCCINFINNNAGVRDRCLYNIR